MSRSLNRSSLPLGLQLDGTSFYSKWGIITKVTAGSRDGYEYVIFDWDTNSGETAQSHTVIAVKTPSPQHPTTWLSRSSGMKLERVGEWIFAFEPERTIETQKFDTLVVDVLNLLEYAKGFPQNI